MKVITQLIKHFWQRGALTPAEIDYLVQHGFIRSRDLPGYSPPPEEPAAAVPPLSIIGTVSPASPLDSVEDSLVRRRPKRGGRAQPRGRVVEIKELCARVAAELARRQAALGTLVRL